MTHHLIGLSITVPRGSRPRKSLGSGPYILALLSLRYEEAFRHGLHKFGYVLD